MSLMDKILGRIIEPIQEDESDHSAPEHLVKGGETKGWSAADLSEDELVDDEWIKANTKVAD